MRKIFLFVPVILSLLMGCGVTQGARNKVSYHYQMGLSYLGEKNYTAALQELTEAEKIDPDDPDLLNQLGLAYFYKKRFDLAEGKFLEAIRHRPNFSAARNNLGVNYLEMKRWDDAVRQFRLVVDDLFYPQQVDASINLSLAYLGKGDYDNATATIRGVIASNSGNPLARLTLGRIYFASGKTELAVTAFRDAIALFGDYATAHYYLALAYMKLDQIEGARASFAEVIRIAPHSEIGQLSREYLDRLKK